MRYFSPFTLLFPILLPTLASAQVQPVHWGDPVMVHSGTQDLVRPRIVLGADDRPIVLWGQVSSGENFVAVAEGDQFSTPERIHPEGISVAVADWQGSDLIANGNMVYAVMKRIPENSGGIYLVMSSDGGHTWGDTLRVDDVPGYKTRFSSIALDADGDPVVQYMRINLQETDHRYMISRVSNGSVQPPVDVSTPYTAGDDCDCCPGQVIADGDRVIALFRDATDNERVIWAVSSNNGGSDLDQGAQIDPTGWVLNSCPATGPDGVIDGDSLRYTWMSAAVNGSKVYIGAAPFVDLSSVNVNNVHPDQPVSISQNHPRIAGSNGIFGVAWEQLQSGQAEIMFAYRTPEMAMMSDPDTVNIQMTGQQRTPDVAYANGVFHIVWADYQENTIMYRTATLEEFIGVSEVSDLPVLKVWPNPARTELNLMPVEGCEDGSMEMLDALGRTVIRSPILRTIDISQIPAGHYALQLRDRNGRLLGRSPVSVAR